MHKKNKANIPTVKTGTFIGYSHKRPVYIPDNCKHCFVCGTTGNGKTVALSNFIKHGAESDYPMLIVDGKGDVGSGSILEVAKFLFNRFRGRFKKCITCNKQNINAEKSDINGTAKGFTPKHDGSN